jgi:tetratricopeptide (TPR) repeat protein
MGNENATPIQTAGKQFLSKKFSDGLRTLSIFIDEPNVLMHQDAISLLKVLDFIHPGEISPDEIIQVIELKGLSYTRTGDYLKAIEIYRTIPVRANVEVRIRLIRYIIQYGGRDQRKLKLLIDDLEKEMYSHSPYKHLVDVYFYFINNEDLSMMNEYINRITGKSPFIVTELIYIMDWYAQYLCRDGDSSKAVEILLDARDKIRHASNANTLNTITQIDLAIAYSFSGDYDDSLRAIALLESTLKTLSEYLDKDNEAHIHNNLGSIYLDIASNFTDIQKSISHLTKSLEYLRDNDLAAKRNMYILRYISLLDAYTKAGHIEYLQKELNFIDTFAKPDNEYISWVYLSKIQFYIIKNNKNKALESLNHIEDILSKQNLVIKLWWVQLSLEVILLLGGTEDRDKFAPLLAEIGGKLATHKGTSYFAHYQLAQGLFAMMKGDYPAAILSLEESVSIRHECKYAYYEGESLVWLMKAHTLAKQYDQASATEKKARSILTPFGKTTPLLRRLNTFKTELKKAQEDEREKDLMAADGTKEREKDLMAADGTKVTNPE